MTDPQKVVWSSDDVLCLNGAHSYRNSSDGVDSRIPTTFDAWWSETTVPIYLIFILLPILNLKDAVFFTKFNSLGTLSVAYITFLAIYKSAQWGINLKGPIVSILHTVCFQMLSHFLDWRRINVGNQAIFAKFSWSNGHALSSFFYSFRNLW